MKQRRAAPARTALFFIAISGGTTIDRFECRLDDQAGPPLTSTDARLVRPPQPGIRIVTAMARHA